MNFTESRRDMKETSKNYKANIRKRAEVALITMPFGLILTPSPAISLLKASLSSSGIHAHPFYFSFLFAKMVGVDSYNKVSILSKSSGYQETGEWIFSQSLFEQLDLDADGYVDHILRKPSLSHSRFLNAVSEKLIKEIVSMRRKADDFLQNCLNEVSRLKPKIVGFSCLFQQKTASLSLAKRIKAQYPETFIVFGGPDCEGIKGIELLRQFPFVDTVISGKAEVVFPELVQYILDDKPIPQTQGVYTRDALLQDYTNDHFSNAVGAANLDELPVPDFSDYFQQLKDYRLRLSFHPYILMETSRGCWWAERKKCTFCSLNGADVSFRSKSGGRVFSELSIIAEKYQVKLIHMTDCALDFKYFKDLIPKLAEQQFDFSIFYETRPTLKKKQVRALGDAGITGIQPGIESLSSSILKLMRKGTTLLQNIQLLKWCKEYGIAAHWNMIVGLPYESPSAYAHMAKIIPQITHLQPPSSVRQFNLFRFSPYFEEPKKFGLTNVTPSPAYSFIYPFEHEVIANLAAYFTYDYCQPQNVQGYTLPVLDAIELWEENFNSSSFSAVENGGKLVILDQRPVAEAVLTNLSGLQKLLYSACDSIQSMSQLQTLIGDHIEKKISKKEIDKLLQPMLLNHLMIKENDHYLSLAIQPELFSEKNKINAEIQEYLRDSEERRIQESLMAKIRVKDLPERVKISAEEIENL